MSNWCQTAPILPVLPTQPVYNQLSVNNLRFLQFHGMEEVIGSIPIRSTNYFNNLRVLRNCLKGPQGSNKNSSLQNYFSTAPIHTSRNFCNPCFMRVTVYTRLFGLVNEIIPYVEDLTAEIHLLDHSKTAGTMYPGQMISFVRPQSASFRPLLTSTFTSTRRLMSRPWGSAFGAAACVAP